MIVFKAGRVRVSIHPLFPVSCVLCALGGGDILPPLIALLTHECGHLAVAAVLRLRVTAVELTPLGGLIDMENLDSAPPIKRFFVALFGPLFSFLLCLLAAFLYRAGTLPFALARELSRASAVLMLFNLLPALPLDGGRMLLAALSAFLDEKRVTRALLLTAKMIAAALCGVSLAEAIQGRYVLLPALAGAYLFYAAAREGKNAAVSYVSRLIGRRLSLDKRDVLTVQQLAAGEDTPVCALLPRLSPQKYHLINVLSKDGLNVIGTLNENELCTAMMDDAGQNLGGLIARRMGIT